MAREKGVVKWFSTEKGYGFIRRESGDEVFVHHTDIDVEGYASLRNGESVEFEVFESDRGPKARKLVPLERESEEPERESPRGRRGRADRAKRASKTDDVRGAVESAEEAEDEPTPRASGRPDDTGRARSRTRPADGALKPLADQLREALGDRFRGFGGSSR